jgi:transcriptional regulator with XRE-family HTH domain
MAGRKAKAIEGDDLSSRLAVEVRRRREKRGLSVEKAASLAGMSVAAWYDLEAHRRQPAISKLPAIAEALGCRPRALLPA